MDAGYWTLPGGGLDFGEDPADAMVREVQEETGFVVRPQGLADINSFSQENGERAFHGIRIIYHTDLIGGTLAHERDGSTDLCAWWTYEEAMQLQLVDLVGVGLELAFSNVELP